MAYKAKPFLVNEHATYRFAELAKLPDTQLVMLVPKKVFVRLPEFIAAYEAVSLAGRFGADPGDYEWEVLSDPQGFKWWRRTVGGDPAYCAAILAPDVSTDPIEVFGMIDIASDTPWWFDAIDDMVRIEMRGDTLAHQRHISELQAQVIVSIRDEYGPRRLITAERDENGIAWRVGSPEEVEKLKDAFVGLVNRARTAILPEEALRKTGELSPQSEQPKPKTDQLKPKTDQLKPGTGSLKSSLSNLLKPKTDQLKPKTDQLKKP